MRREGNSKQIIILFWPHILVRYIVFTIVVLNSMFKTSLFLISLRKLSSNLIFTSVFLIHVPIVSNIYKEKYLKFLKEFKHTEIQTSAMFVWHF